MTDRELLELAARAAGIELAPEPFHHGGPVGAAFTGEAGFWNPLHDDGDALRLAVKLHLWFRPMAFLCADAHEVDVFLGGDGKLATERANGDPCAATRRAIVRAAAEIGKAGP